LYRDIPEDMRALIEPIVDDFGLELVDVERIQGRAPWQLRVVVDTCEGDGRVPVDTCAEVSREVGACLDAADAIPVAYRLEISSPGLDRVLAREKDFARAVGREVRLQTHRPVAGRRRFRGRLVAFDGAEARLQVDGEEVAIPFDVVRRANAVYAFSKDDFAAGQRR
jgi:ribosome maturation factor RimP